jgi:hypothetical protein
MDTGCSLNNSIIRGGNIKGGGCVCGWVGGIRWWEVQGNIKEPKSPRKIKENEIYFFIV